jgi:hypothetical protein
MSPWRSGHSGTNTIFPAHVFQSLVGTKGEQEGKSLTFFVKWPIRSVASECHAHDPYREAPINPARQIVDSAFRCLRKSKKLQSQEAGGPYATESK